MAKQVKQEMKNLVSSIEIAEEAVINIEDVEENFPVTECRIDVTKWNALKSQKE